MKRAYHRFIALIEALSKFFSWRATKVGSTEVPKETNGTSKPAPNENIYPLW